MARKVRRLKPRRTWTNRLAWAVWKIRQNNKERHASGGGDNCPLTFENGILNANRILCSNQLLLGANSAWIDGELWVDGEPWID